VLQQQQVQFLVVQMGLLLEHFHIVAKMELGTLIAALAIMLIQPVVLQRQLPKHKPVQMEPHLQLTLIVAIMEQKMRFVVLGLTYIQHAMHQLLLNHSFHKDMAKIKCTLFRVLGKKVK
jgi:hypothetical protein